MKGINAKIEFIPLRGGILGMVKNNVPLTLHQYARAMHEQGYRVHHMEPYRTGNPAVSALQVVALVLTCGLWTFGCGYLAISYTVPIDGGAL